MNPGSIGPVSPAGEPLADAGMRVLARFLDGIILLIINAVLVASVIIGSAGGLTGAVDDDVAFGTLLFAQLVGLAISFAWEPLLTKLKGGSPMKLAFGMKVVRADNGGPVEWSHSIIRWIVVAIWTFIPVLSFLAPLVLLIVSLVFLFTKPLRQAVWDLAAKTLVVKSR
jgi:uncharacterized RDD family membrane protein YckC